MTGVSVPDVRRSAKSLAARSCRATAIFSVMCSWTSTKERTTPGMGIMGGAVGVNPHRIPMPVPRLHDLPERDEGIEHLLRVLDEVLDLEVESDQIVEALQLGAHGIVLKSSAIDVLRKSIRCVNDGQYWVGQEGVSGLIQALRTMKPSISSSAGRADFGLTSREKQVLTLIGAGYTNKDLARELSISENTAKHHVTNIFDKLGVSNRLELLLFATEHRLINSD